MLANLDAGDIRLDWMKLAPEFPGSVRLQVVHIHVRRAARQVDHDCRLRPRWRGGLVRVVGCLRLQPEHIRQGQTCAKCADLEEIAAIDPVAKTLFNAQESKHENSPPTLV